MMNNETPNKRKILFYIQPVLAGYRASIIEALASEFKVYAFYDNTNALKQGHKDASSKNFLTIQSPSITTLGNRLFYQKNIIQKLINIKPDAIIIFANPRYLSFWLLMIVCKIMKIDFYSHGQGLYSYSKPSRLRSFMYRTMCAHSTKYVCYTELSRQTMLAIGGAPEKLITIKNSLQLQTDIDPSLKTYKESGILFIGRLRDGCRIDDLIKAVQICRGKGLIIDLHVIGSGELEYTYKKQYQNINWIHWYGAVHDDYRIAEISKSCRMGCYPGDAGLSVVHLFSLALPPLVHRSIEDHMGPEPSYVIENENGFLFSKQDYKTELASSISSIWSLSPEELRTVAIKAYATYLNLNDPPMGDQFVQLVLDSNN